MKYIDLLDNSNAKLYLKKIQDENNYSNAKMSRITGLSQTHYTLAMGDLFFDFLDEDILAIKDNLKKKGIETSIIYWWREIFGTYGDVAIAKHLMFIKEDLEQHYNCSIEVKIIDEFDACSGYILKRVGV